MHSLREDFHRFVYEAASWEAAQTTYQGIPVAKYPTDLWMYQEQIHRRKPELIIETGTWHGGSALYFAHLLDLLGGEGGVLTLDITHASAEQRAAGSRPTHPRIRYLLADSADRHLAAGVRSRSYNRPTMVVLDSAHEADHVLKELIAWAPLVSKGQLLVVEDTNVNGHPVAPDWGPGPTEALDEWLRLYPEATRFQPIDDEDKFGITFHPGGWLEAVY